MSEFKVDQNLVAETITALTALYNNPEEKQYVKARSLLESAAQSKSKLVPTRADQVVEETSFFYETEVEWLDEWLGGGVRKGEIVVVGAVPAGGKTHFLVWLASQYILQGARVAHFVGEDIMADVRDYYQMCVGKKGLKNLWLVDIQDYSFSAQDVEEVYNEMRRKKIEVDLIVPDHLDLMQSRHRVVSDWQDAAAVIRDLKVFAKRNDAIVLTASQLHPQTKEQRGTGRFYRAKTGKSANADIIVFVDNVIGGTEYHMSREKARGRKVGPDTKKKVLDVDWSTMEVEDIT